MNRAFAYIPARIRNAGRGLTAGALALVASVPAFAAEGDDAITQVFAAINISAVAAAVVVLVVAAIGISMAFKSGQLGKKGVRAI